MADPLVIPPGLKPADGRFGSGPSKVPAGLVVSLADAPMGTSHRQPPVREVVRRVRDGLHELLAVPDGHEVVLGNGGSTQFWDIAALQLVDERAQHVVCGEFSAKFAAVVQSAPFLADPSIVRATPGDGAVPRAREDVDTYCWPQNETSTGVALPVAPVPALALVDATSSAGAIATDLAHVDAYYFAPQKVFAADAGLWIAVLSPAALERAGRARPDRWVPPSLSLPLAIDNSAKQQTYNTPAIASLWLLAQSVEALLAAGGVAAAAARSVDSSGRLYAWAEASAYARPFVADPAYRSPVVVTVDLDQRIDAAALAATLRANGIVDTEPYRGLARNQLRLGVYPAVDPDDVSALIACIEYAVERLGV